MLHWAWAWTNSLKEMDMGTYVRLNEQMVSLLGEFKTKVRGKNISKPTLETIYIYVKLPMFVELKSKLCHEKITIVKGKTFPCCNTCK
jgi:hypothetical protein